ncbi:MAG: DNA cytosine methyltransferase [Candidatus Marinimicrobia bacterium]|nr:DNA cytosine methyltransferase [Candidatus Neomarinimicrobiota bacterium]
MNINILSFFTGGGFMDIGFGQADFSTIWSNEYDPLFADMFEAGINSLNNKKSDYTPVKISDRRSIELITCSEITSSAFDNIDPKVFGIIGGPPCQDFSISGKIQGFNGSRGRLTKIYLEKIYDLEPTFFVMENVAGLWRIKKNKEKLLDILKQVEQKYYVTKKILNALEYGVPQDRERLFVIGFLKSKIKKTGFNISHDFNWPNPIYKDATTKYSWPERSTYQGKPRKPNHVPKELCVQSCLVSEKNKSIANADEVFKAYSEKFNSIEEGDTRTQSFKRLHRYKYSPTACYGNNEVHLHPYLPRRLSVRETLRIQGVPDSYKLPRLIGQHSKSRGLTAKYKMIGNGVPVPLAKQVALSVRQCLEENVL